MNSPSIQKMAGFDANFGKLSVEDMAAVCHEAIRRYATQIGETPDPPWGQLIRPQQEAAIENCLSSIETQDFEPEGIHYRWIDRRHQQGWKAGALKDAVAKTHPCLVNWQQLPDVQQRKDEIWQAVLAGLVQFA